MHRFGFSFAFGSLLISLVVASLRADPPADDHSKKLSTLAVQQAMAAARQNLRDGQPKKAVESLEEQLPRAGGHHGFLELLRDAYRDCIVKLSLDRETALAQRYVQRLGILDPQAARELTITPDNGTPIKFEARPDPKTAPLPLPNFAAVHPAPAAAPAQPPVVTATSTGAKAATFRGKVEQPGSDPFDLGNQRLPATPDSFQLATQLLARANEEFGRRRYREARMYYEQAFQADQRSIDAVRDSWAYCMLNDVVAALNRPGLEGKSLTDLQRDVRGALAISQTAALSTEGQKLLREIEQRTKTSPAADRTIADSRVTMQHFGKNPQGWHVSETPHFRIFHNQQRDLVERVGQIAEQTRLEASRKWFGNDGGDWQGKCELVLHASAADYSRQTGVPTTSPGHSRIESDPGTNRIIGRRMDLHVDNPSMLEAVLPHEATHCILAGQFGPYQVPRWADEGMAVLSEPAEKTTQHRQNLLKAAQEGQLFSVKELLELDNYPQPRRISVFYAQSVALVDFLVQQRGPTTFSEFVRDGLRAGWDAAARKHYGWDLTQVQQRWDAQVRGDSQRLTAGR